MSYSLDSSKRKFHRLMDSFSTNTGQPVPLGRDGRASSTHLPVGLPASKRARLSITKRAFSGSSGRSSLKPPASQSNTKTSALQDFSDDDNMEGGYLPYCPADRKEFLNRLKSYSSGMSKWSIKPDNMNEVAWAKNGWILTDIETVTCVSCKKRLVLKYKEQDPERVEISEDDPRDFMEQEEWRRDAREKLAERYSDMTNSEHFESCPWKKRVCDESIYRIPMFNIASAVTQLRSRYESLLKISSKLPTTMDLPSSIDLPTIYAKFLLCAYTTSAAYPIIPPTSAAGRPSPALTAFNLAIHGWSSDSHSLRPFQDIIECQTCFRHVGLWLYRPGMKADGSVKEPALVKLSPAAEHRLYCPWANAETQNVGNIEEDTKLRYCCGWEAVARAVLSSKGRRGEGNREVAMGKESVPVVADANRAQEAIAEDTTMKTTTTADAPVTRPTSKTGVSRTTTAAPSDIISIAETTTNTTTNTSNGKEVTQEEKEEKDKNRWAKWGKLKKSMTFSKLRKSGGGGGAGGTVATTQT